MIESSVAAARLLCLNCLRVSSSCVASDCFTVRRLQDFSSTSVGLRDEIANTVAQSVLGVISTEAGEAVRVPSCNDVCDAADLLFSQVQAVRSCRCLRTTDCCTVDDAVLRGCREGAATEQLQTEQQKLVEALEHLLVKVRP